ncbi:MULTISPECIES: glycine betaine/L-proline ABC transporter ATP-binding protein [unclassified Thiomonas]|uniref:quaternary amine ABC transporter ATP-binding protein n=1 Tax=unclassified Thiomonas TaxID=2625466 RepID=UPI0004DBA566|nr:MULTISPECIES: glycine betaine/L-proline ABC transporter ATP-binding protein [unclassified Thiomonas]CDW92377.1 glycine betaine transporter subunit; ATP-binding compoent of ABC superfamily [Thiomonas sp. CB2]VDY05934.1 glycine betaine transporter subunit; ATP-binding compoent of ABC superfamily [Thiomonas sp. Bio17B3]VDY10769.1 glycine betaine transporter subunit; ATP-binding compoent of ABC superfamily [Thiomonas sp. Sup16B3]VDY14196.1 Glycine betaine transport ATP-binding protein OpuAA [Thi
MTDNPQTHPKISIQSVSKIFGKHPNKAIELLKNGLGKSKVQAETGVVVGVHDVSLDIYPGEIFVIMGLSGSGKSTLLRLINRLQDPTVGRILVDGEDATAMNAKALRALRRQKFGMVFQSFALLPHRTVLGNVEFGLEIQGMSKTQRQERAMQVIETVGLKNYESRYASELSGGMQQRVGLARALAADPEILLMDEAFSALDPLIRSQLQDDLLEIQERLGKTIVFVSHDLDEAIKIGTRIAILRDGRLIQIGTPQQILSAPADDYVSAFVEGADRTKVLTAEQIMQPLRVAANIRDSARTVLRKMERSGFSGLIVIDSARNLKGFIELAHVTAQRDAERISLAQVRPLPTATPDAKLADLIQRVNTEGSPLCIVDARNRVIGVVDKSSLIAALAQSDQNTENAAAPAADSAAGTAQPVIGSVASAFDTQEIDHASQT